LMAQRPPPLRPGQQGGGWRPPAPHRPQDRFQPYPGFSSSKAAPHRRGRGGRY
jgi:hypothetical protein